MKTLNKFTTLAIAAIATSAAAATLYVTFSGTLDAGYHRNHRITVGTGTFTAWAHNWRDPGDLDIQVLDEDGDPMCSDTRPDNFAMCDFYSDHRQTVTVQVINASDDNWADYTGSVSP